MSIPLKGRRDRPPRPPSTDLPAPTLPTRQQIEDAKAGILDHIAESVIVRVVGVGHGADTHEITWGCGICQGASLGYDRPDGRGAYAHRDWCPRK